MPREFSDHLDTHGDASLLPIAAPSLNRRNLTSLRRKISRAPSVASSSFSGFRLKGAFSDPLDSHGDASLLPIAAPSLNRRNLKSLQRKISRAPSVASSSLSGFRLKGAFLVGRRGSPSTPVPRWKVHDEGPIPLNMGQQQGQHHCNDDDRHVHDYDHHHHSPLPRVSARKLAASLWELQELSFFRGGPQSTGKGERTHQPHMLPYMNNNASHANMGTIPHARPFSPASSMGSHVHASMRTQQQRHTSVMEKHRLQGVAAKAEEGLSSRPYGREA